MYRCQEYTRHFVENDCCLICSNQGNEMICKECREILCPITEGLIYPAGREACYICNFKCKYEFEGVKQMENGKKNKMNELKDTFDMMISDDYKERFKAEYWQTKIRYEKLKKFNTKIEAAEIMKRPDCFVEPNKISAPNHDCPADLLLSQQHTMGEYLHQLELRAEIENIDLEV